MLPIHNTEQHPQPRLWPYHYHCFVAVVVEASFAVVGGRVDKIVEEEGGSLVRGIDLLTFFAKLKFKYYLPCSGGYPCCGG